MKVTLVRPPQVYPNEGFPVGPRSGLPLGLLSIAAFLERGGHRVNIIDALIDFDIRQLDMSKRWIHFGQSWEELRNNISSGDPEIIGIGNQFTTNLSQSFMTAKIAKEACPKAKVVIGGPHASSAPEDILASPDVDYACVGEGEPIMLNLANRAGDLNGVVNIPGLAYRNDGEIIETETRSPISDLDTLPLPAYHLLNMERYFFLERKGYISRATYRYPGSERAVSVITSRGCPFNCVFCGIGSVMGKRWRAHSPGYVMYQLEHLVKNYGVRHIHFEDDNFTLNRHRFQQILAELNEAKLGVTWDTPNGIRADYLDRPLLKAMRKAGCTYTVMGVESGDQGILDRVIGKKIKLSDVARVADICAKTGIDLHAFFVIGLPGESLKNMEKTLKFALNLKRRFNVFPHLNLANPLVGSELYRVCRDSGYLTSPDLPQTYGRLRGDKQERLMIKTEEFEPADLYRLSKEFHRRLIAISTIHTAGFLFRRPKILASLLISVPWRRLISPAVFSTWIRTVFAEKLLFERCLERGVGSAGFNLIDADPPQSVYIDEGPVKVEDLNVS